MYWWVAVDPLNPETWECLAKLAHEHKYIMQQVVNIIVIMEEMQSIFLPSSPTVISEGAHTPVNTLHWQVVVDHLVPETWECVAKLPHGHK